MTKRSDLLLAIKTRLATITIANAYTHDLGSNSLYRNNGLPIDYQKPLSLSWEDEQDSSDRENNYDKISVPITFKVVAQVPSGVEPATVITGVVGDLFKAIKVDPSWGLPRFKTERATVESDVDGENGKLFALVSVTVNVFYLSSTWEF